MNANTTPTKNSRDDLADFMQAMADQRLACPETLILDSQIHTSHVTGDKAGTRNGRYKYHDDDYPTGMVSTWREHGPGNWITWSSQQLDLTTPQERKAHKFKQAERAPQTKAEEEVKHAEAVIAAQYILDTATATDPDHLYLKRKEVEPYGIKQEGDALIIPICGEAGTLQSLQYLGPDRFKQFLTDGKISGGFFTIGEPGAVLWRCEGYFPRGQQFTQPRGNVSLLRSMQEPFERGASAEVASP